MPEKYHISTTPVPPRLPRIGKYGIVDWREDCARCHNCVKKACVYDRHRQEADYIKNLKDALENIAARHKNCNDSCPVKKITEQALSNKPESEVE